MQRLTLFLTLVGLTALLVGGVGVSNAVRAYLEAKGTTIATLKCLGAPNRTVFQIYLGAVAGVGRRRHRYRFGGGRCSTLVGGYGIGRMVTVFHPRHDLSRRVGTGSAVRLVDYLDLRAMAFSPGAGGSRRRFVSRGGSQNPHASSAKLLARHAGKCTDPGRIGDSPAPITGCLPFGLC